MKLHCLTLTNFGSFAGEQTFRFPEAPGLYFMQGVNQAEPRLEANGAGKTTIWKALTWLLYGKTPKGLKAGDVCNWEAGKGTKVTLSFSDASEGNVSIKVMTRTWKPNSWTLQDLFGNTTDLTKDDSNVVLAEVGLAFTPFLNTILMAQGEPMFLDLKHEAKAALFSDVMGLDRWLDASAKASDKARAQDSISRKYERELAALRATLAQIQGQDLTSHANSWEAERTDKTLDLEEKYGEALAKLRRLKESLPELAAKENQQRSTIQLLQVVLEDARQDLQDLVEDSDVCRDALARAKAQYEAALDARESMQTGKCPTCGQNVKEGHVHAPSAESLRRLLRTFDTVQHNWDAISKKLDTATAKTRTANKEVLEARDDLTLAEDNHRRMRQSVQACERELDVMEEQAEELLAQKNPYTELQEIQQREGLRVATEAAAVQRLLDDSDSRYSMFSFWVRGFKELRLQLIAEALNELEVEVNSCVTSLGLVDWELNFQVDRETKGGNIQRGFNVFVRSPHNEMPVPWEAWSGGEAQRLRVAATMGLANLIRSRSGTGINLEVWDEPSTGLSKQGITDLLEALELRARQEGRQIWVVDHTAHAFGGFAGGAVITKTKSGSELTQY